MISECNRDARVYKYAVCQKRSPYRLRRRSRTCQLQMNGPTLLSNCAFPAAYKLARYRLHGVLRIYGTGRISFARGSQRYNTRVHRGLTRTE